MARGQPDFGMYAATSTIASVADMGELAARLYSPDVFERQGNVAFIDTFDNDLVPYHIDLSGLGADVKVVSEYSKTGLFAAKLTCGSTLSHLSSIYKYLSYPAFSKWGFEVAFTFNDAIERYDFVLTLAIGTDYYDVHIQYLNSIDTLRYRAFGGAYVPILTPVSPYALPRLFHVLKVVADFNTRQYVRVILDNRRISLAGIPMYKSAGLFGYFMLADFKVIEDRDANPTCYIDEFIITQNEP